MPKKLTTEEFIAKARAVHGDKYDYSKTVYKNAKDKVVIICPIHGEFPQTPDNHLHGQGCSKCAGTARLDTKTFIAKAKEIHGDKYDYSKVVYKNNSTKVIIICPEHGEFEQQPNNHLMGERCPDCAKAIVMEKRRHSTEYFIKQAKNVHGDRYDYSKVEYKSTKEKVCIICLEHGEFWQSPSMHMRGVGCPKCSGAMRLSTEEFIAKARAIHGDKYDYSKVEYVNTYTKVVIVCPIHGEFEQIPSNHLRGKGCNLCTRNVPLDTETFTAKAREVHGDHYDYSKVEYKNTKTKVKIICPEHGVFEQTPSNHLKGQGCTRCSEWSIPDNVYLLVDNNYKPTRMKIGVTCDIKTRLKHLKAGNKHSALQPTPFKIFKKVCYKVGPGKAYEIEQMFHRYYASRNLGYTGFDGATEWFEYDESTEKILGMIAGLIGAKSYNKK